MTVEEVLWMAYDAPMSEDELVRLRVVEQVWKLIDSVANKMSRATPYTDGPALAVLSLTRHDAIRAEVPSVENGSGDAT